MVFIIPSSKNEFITKGLGGRELDNYFYIIENKENWSPPIFELCPIQGGRN